MSPDLELPLRPIAHRRHTTSIPARRLSRPYRSSPLAGPALSSANAISDVPNPSRVASSPDLKALPRVTHSSPSYSPRVDTHTLRRNVSTSAKSDPHVDLARLAAEEKLNGASHHEAGPSSPSSPSSVKLSKRISLRLSRRASITPSIFSTSTRSTSPSPPVPSLPNARRRRSTITPSTSRDPSENWLTITSAPPFSRLSLAAEGVILPISAKAYAASSSSSRESRSRPSSPISIRSTDSASSVSALSVLDTGRGGSSNTSLGCPPSVASGDSSVSGSRSPRVHWYNLEEFGAEAGGMIGKGKGKEVDSAAAACNAHGSGGDEQPIERSRSFKRMWDKVARLVKITGVKA
ncbi:hypothetical protein EW146_g1657 [Bondarzewia mesenterica]|uniref:Uncharacterized protein n=1 Tax=Bondarzewia mesenterica TaxID=1095465 RepID=A0A4S4M5C9_9AGAM|nr:hypothetical protein EW146_g1657 [Bondarzewia mesenterica]